MGDLQFGIKASSVKAKAAKQRPRPYIYKTKAMLPIQTTNTPGDMFSDLSLNFIRWFVTFG